MTSKVIASVKKLFFSWYGVLVILACTLLFFSPYIARLDSYSEGGDAMFNAWLLARTHHCLMRQDCPNYLNGNIFFPHRDSMLFSETQLSAGLLTLPLHFVNPHPIFSFNVWVITQFFLSGMCMYLLAKHLSRNHEVISTVAGLVFAFAPMRVAVVAHMQNGSIWYLPLVILLLLQFLKTKKIRYLPFIFVVLVLYFYASWYQMVFGLIALGVLLLCLLVFNYAKPRFISAIFGVIILAVVATLPLAKEYVRFSATNNAKFSVIDQIEYSSSLVDYFIPQLGTMFGALARHSKAHINAINPDSISYHGLVLYAVAFFVGIVVIKRRRKLIRSRDRDAALVIAFLCIALVGFVVSLGPYLKVFDSTRYILPNGFAFQFPMPYLLFDKVLPQLSFIRAIGRASMLVLFSLSCLLAMLPHQLQKHRAFHAKRRFVMGLLIALIVFELMPLQRVRMASQGYAYNLSIPAVYEYIKSRRYIDNYIVLHADEDYPNAPWRVAEPEHSMWAGYVNRKVFNGYSGYFPPSYESDLRFFKSLSPEVAEKLKRYGYRIFLVDQSVITQYGLRYVLVDKTLSQSDPDYIEKARELWPERIYLDDRYELFKL
jgi:hypothetical protein